MKWRLVVFFGDERFGGRIVVAKHNLREHYSYEEVT